MTATLACTTCHNFENVEVERDEDGGYAYLKQTPCTTCGTALCSSCDWANCDGCGKPFCGTCLQPVEDGTPNPLHCCKACVGEWEAECNCHFSGDQADASDCELHGSARPVTLAPFTDEEWPECPKLEPVTAVVMLPNIPEWKREVA